LAVAIEDPLGRLVDDGSDGAMELA